MAVQSKAAISHLKSAFVFCVSFAGGSFGMYLAIQRVAPMSKLQKHGHTEVKEGLIHRTLDRTDIGSDLHLGVLCLRPLPPLPQLLPCAASYNSDVWQLLFADADSKHHLLYFCLR